jgi:hypothetical protein
MAIEQGTTMPSRTRCLLLVSCLVAVVLAGCGGPRLGRVTGRVTVGGKPVTSGTIMFHPDAGPTAVGAIGADGTYTLTTFKRGDGALVGSHRVTIEATTVGAGSMVEPKSIDEELAMRQKGKVLVAGKVEWVVPEKYSRLETTDLKATVESGANTRDFDIPRR